MWLRRPQHSPRLRRLVASTRLHFSGSWAPLVTRVLSQWEMADVDGDDL